MWRRTPISDIPELLAAYRGHEDPTTVMVMGWGGAKFECPSGHQPKINPHTFMAYGCPHCKAANGKKFFADHASAELLAQWHPTNTLKPDKVALESTRAIWWRSACCGHEWEESPRNRQKYGLILCPRCGTKQQSLAVQLPDLAAEWSPRNEKTPWHYLPFASVVAEWVCSENPRHVWTAPLASRSGGSGCPECAVAGKSKVELDHLEAALGMFGNARSGQRLRSKQFVGGNSWVVDILVDVDGLPLIIEYDGVYWHTGTDKTERDVRKSSDLLQAGFVLVRLREKGLRPLPIHSPQYLELLVHPDAPRPTATMHAINDWLTASHIRRLSVPADEDVLAERISRQ
jgi:Probable Zinc-ribbon domain